MTITRRKFIQISSLATVSTPFFIHGCTPANDQAHTGLPSIDTLYKEFRDPPNTSRPFVRWWWNGNRLTREEIIRELDLLREAGIGGVEINPISLPGGSDPSGYDAIEWLSEEWIDILQSTLKAANERGIVCDIIVGSGWPFGGEFLEKSEQTQMMTFETKNLKGPETYSFLKKELLDQVDPPIHSKHDKIYKEITGLRLIPSRMEQFDPGLDLTERAGDEKIVVNVPEGEYVLYYLVKLTGYQAVIHGAPGAAGPVLNHYNKQAVEKFLNRMSDKLNQTLGGLEGHFRSMFCDSLEIEGANWNDDLPDEFEKRRGYSMTPYLPFVLYKVGHMGNPVEEEYGSQLSEEAENIVQRVRYDFYITRMELFNERFINPFNTWCHNHGVKSRIQAYGRGYHPLDASLEIDIPECETWLRETVGTDYADTGWRGRSYSVINKFVSSAARLSGKRTVSCEEITNTSMVFNADLETVKVTGDQSNLSGVTHSVLHGFNYSPPEAPFPGWVQFGTFFSEHNPWWPYMRLWADYKARLSSVFQKAEPYADIAILHPLADLWMKFGPQRDPFPVVKHPSYQHNVWEAIQQNGYGCDYVSEKIIQKSSFSHGSIKFGSRSYSALVLMEVESIQPKTAEALKKLADAGGKIVFIEKQPVRSPEFKDHEKKDAGVIQRINSIINENPERTGVFSAPEGDIKLWFKELATKFKLKPYMDISNPHDFINQVYFKMGDIDIFFISNYNVNEPYTLKVEFNIEGKTPWIWNAETGTKEVLSGQGSPSSLSLHFGPAEAKLIVFESNDEGDPHSQLMPEHSIIQPVNGPWEVDLKHVKREGKAIRLDTLIDFNTNEDLRSFAGVIHYGKSIEIREPEQYNFLDLGKVEGISEVSINEIDLGTKWYGFHRYPLQNSLVKGTNRIEIKVTTTLGNYLKTLENNPVSSRWMGGQEYRSMGLLGPVNFLG